MTPPSTEPTGPGQSCFCHPGPDEAFDADLVLRSLAHPHRREVLCLLDVEPRWRRDELAEHIESEVDHAGPYTRGDADLALYHWHLPLLAEAGLVAADDDFRLIERGEDFELVRAMVDAATSVLP